tara:strand:+ start:530 stop:868 length:339 start_codon:yes stop_codon:yes gene_type:complete
MQKIIISAILFFFTLTQFTFASDVATIDTGDTTWIILSTILVMIMTPGLAFFYSGMVRKKNVISTIVDSYMKLSIISIIWVLWGYTIAFGDSVAGLFGNSDYLFFNNYYYNK